MSQKVRKPNVIAFAVDKGGVGKTTSVLNISAGLATHGYHVLAIDLDQQSNLTETFLPELPKETLLDALLDPNKVLPITPVAPNLDIVPASHKMFGIGLALITDMAKAPYEGRPVYDMRRVLRQLITPIVNEYDYVLLDCPPSDNLMMINALYAATGVIIVANAEPFCVAGVRNYIDMMKAVKTDLNPQLNLVGVIINNYETSSVGHRKAEEALRKYLPQHVFGTVIRHSRPLYNATLEHKDIFQYDPKSIGAYDFNRVVNEFIERTKI